MGSDADALLWTRRHFTCDNTENNAADKGNPMGAPAGETYLQLQSGAAGLLLPAEPARLPVRLLDGPGGGAAVRGGGLGGRGASHGTSRPPRKSPARHRGSR